ncbi:MAG: copper transport protein [Mycobacteriales bacterium]
MGWWRRAACTVLPAAALVVAAAGPASAHAYLVGSDPADGSVLAAAPASITLRFSESVQQRDTAVEVLAGSGRRFAATSVQLRHAAGATGADTEQPVEVVVGLPPLPPDTYRVSWRTLSSDDLHRTSGVLVFGVQRDVTAAGAAADPPPRPGEAALRWLGLLGTAALLGGLLLALLAEGAGAPPALRRRLARPGVAGGMAAAGVAPVLLLVQAAVGGPGAFGAAGRLLTSVSYGPRWLAREASLLVLVTIAARLAAQRTPGGARAGSPGRLGNSARPAAGRRMAGGRLAGYPRRLGGTVGRVGRMAGGRLAGYSGRLGGTVGRVGRMSGGRLAAYPGRLGASAGRTAGRPTGFPGRSAAVAGLAAGVLGVTSALLGHASAVSGSRPVWLLADSVHLVVALTWAGGVGLAGLVLAPALRGPDQRAAALAVLRAFGGMAAAGVVLLVVTGLLLAGGAVASLDALLLSSYGRTLLIKLALAGVAGLAALRSSLLLRRRSDRAGAAIRREALALATVLGAAAVLAAVAPALGPRFAAPAAGAAPVASAQAGDLVETLSVRPNRPGRNVIGIGVFDSRRPAPGPLTGVSVTFRSPDGTAAVARSARLAADGNWTVTVDDLRAPGRWRLTVTASRAGLPPIVTGIDWAVADPSARTPLISAARLAGPLDLAAALIAALAAVGVAIFARTRRRPPGRRPADASHGLDRPPTGPPPGDPATAPPGAPAGRWRTAASPWPPAGDTRPGSPAPAGPPV